MTQVGSGKLEGREEGLARGERRVEEGVGGNGWVLGHLGLPVAPGLSHRKGSISIFSRTRCFSVHPALRLPGPIYTPTVALLRPHWPFSCPRHTQALAQALAGTAPASGLCPTRSHARVLLLQPPVHLLPSPVHLLPLFTCCRHTLGNLTTCCPPCFASPLPRAWSSCV